MKDKEFVRDLAESYANVCLIDRNVVASVHLEDKNDEAFWNARLQKMLSSIDVLDNGCSFLNRTSDNFKKELLLLNVEEHDFEEYKNVIAGKSIKQSNAYLYIQGHKIYGLVNMIGHLLQDKVCKSFSETCLLPDVQLEGYDEINQVYYDLSKILL